MERKQQRKPPRRALTANKLPYTGDLHITIRFITFCSLMPKTHVPLLLKRLAKLVQEFNPGKRRGDRCWPVVSDLQDAAIDRMYSALPKERKKETDPGAVVFRRWGDDSLTRIKSIRADGWMDDEAEDALYSVCADGKLRR